MHLNKKSFFIAIVLTIVSFGVQAYATKLEVREDSEQQNNAIVAEKQSMQQKQKESMRKNQKKQIEEEKKDNEDMLAKEDEDRFNSLVKNMDNYILSENDKPVPPQVEQSNQARTAYNQDHLVSAGSRGVFANDAYSFNVTLPSNVTAMELNQVLSNTGLAGLGDAYVQAEQETGVNAVFLCAVTALESGWGRSALTNGKNNIAGYGAYDSSPYDSAISFNNKSSCILTVARAIARDYVTPSGSYYAGNTIAAINRYYSTSSNWKNEVFNIANSIQNDINKL